MKIRGIELGHVCNSSGCRNFFGRRDQYWHSRLANWEGSTFQSKTSTLLARMNPSEGRGNMPIDPETLRPTEWKPACIKVYPFHRVTLNAVGLSGPGFPALIARGEWQRRTRPIFISVGAESRTASDIATEMAEIAKVLLKEMTYFNAPVVLVQNVSCPNIGHDQSNVVTDARAGLEPLRAVGVSIFLNLNVLLAPAAAATIMPSRYRIAPN